MPTHIEMPAVRRDATLRAESFDETDNTIEIVWTTGARVRRSSWWDGPYDEELEVTPKAIRLDRLNAGAPFLNTHDSWDLRSVLGSIVPGSVKIEKGRGTARVKLSRAADVADAVLKIREGDVRNVSVGYRVHKVIKTEGQEGDVPLHRVVDWEPLEISAVPIPADPGAQVRSGKRPEGAQTFPVLVIDQTNRKVIKMPEDNPAPAAPDILGAERQRAVTIQELADRANAPTLARSFIASGASVDEFRSALLDHLVQEERRIHPGGPGHQTAPASVADASHDQRRGAAIENALLHRAAPADFPLDTGRDFMSLPLLEVGRACLEARGVRTAGMSKMQLAGEALAQRSGGMMSTSDFPVILANVLNKTLRNGYEAAPQTFRPLVRVTTVPDFKEVSRAQLSEAPGLEKVNEHGEFKRGSMGEAGEKYKVETFGRIVAITRQVLINDDLGAFTRIPRAFGVQAAQLESDLVWAQILGNPVMGDGTTLFHANHKNLGTAGAIDVASIAAGRRAMSLQMGLDGQTVLNLSPSYIIVPTAMETTAEQLLTSIVPTKISDTVPAKVRSLEIIAEPRLDIGIKRYGLAGSASNWFLAASPNLVDVIELAYLEGAQGVYTETKPGFDVDGVEIKVRLDVGAKVIDHRGLWKNPFAG